MKLFIFWTACIVLATVPAYFVFNKIYKDGIVGRFSLSVISITAWTFLMDAWSTESFYSYNLLGQTVWLMAAFAVFFIWHLVKFRNRVLRKDTPPECKEKRSGVDRRFVTR